MVKGVIPIHPWELCLATGFVLAAGLLSWTMTLGLGRGLIVGTIRTYLQLTALGFVLRWVFANQTWWITAFILLLMTAVAAHTLLGRVQTSPSGLYAASFVGMLISGITVTLAVTQIIIHARPWYEARYTLPIAGMILGNSMTGISISLERLFSDLEHREDEVLAYIALGATPWQAALPSIRASLTAGLIPTINSMNAVGIVSIPGMMTGQILAGADPAVASRYQIMVMLMLSASTAIGAMITIFLSHRKSFDSEGLYVPRKRRNGLRKV